MAAISRTRLSEVLLWTRLGLLLSIPPVTGGLACAALYGS